MKNICGKMRLISKGQIPYITWTDPRTGWQHNLLKTYTASNKGPHARWLMDFHSNGHDIGDVYISGFLPSLINSLAHNDNVTWDETLWPTRSDVVRWINQ